MRRLFDVIKRHFKVPFVIHCRSCHTSYENVRSDTVKQRERERDVSEIYFSVSWYTYICLIVCCLIESSWKKSRAWTSLSNLWGVRVWMSSLWDFQSLYTCQHDPRVEYEGASSFQGANSRKCCSAKISRLLHFQRRESKEHPRLSDLGRVSPGERWWLWYVLPASKRRLQVKWDNSYESARVLAFV